MPNRHKESALRKQGSVVEWSIAQDDADWERLRQPPPPDCEPAARRTLRLNRSFWSVAALFLLLASAGGWLWRTDQVRAHQAAVAATVTAPDAALWGLERSLETPYFVYHFRQNDALAIVAVLPQMDTLYHILRRNFGLSLTTGTEKLVIDVSVTQPPGYAVPWSGAPHRVSVPSPALYLAPVELTDAELLAQSIALPLFEQVLAQVSKQDAINGGNHGRIGYQSPTPRPASPRAA